jgi:hypothetical protein
MRHLRAAVLSCHPGKALLGGLSAVTLFAGMLLGANVASADSVQVQSYQRDSQTAGCPHQSWETPWQANWGLDSSWKPSWEQWANTGTGGWTCTRSIVWASSSPATYNIGDVGPGGGLVFLKSAGLTYEMAPRTWSGAPADPALKWCDDADSDVVGAMGTAIGSGATNTTAMMTACPSGGAGNLARSYNGGGLTDWFLPSKDEMNALYSYRSSIIDTDTFGFADANYWTSSQFNTPFAWAQFFVNGSQATGGKDTVDPATRVRPIRAF